MSEPPAGEASSSREPPSIPINPDLQDPEIDPEIDSDSDWEYEYSATETETYYLTLDMSLPAFCTRKGPPAHHGGRSGALRNWANDVPGDVPVTHTLDASHAASRSKLKEKSKRAAGHLDDQDDEDEHFSDIQILDLHAPNPVISYRGKVLQGRWAQVLGTEALFIKRDAKNPLPALMNYPDEMDLLAASAARIITTEVIPEPRTGPENNIPDQAVLEDLKKEHHIHIPLPTHLTDARERQTTFLENLMALKKKRGEEDLVTVYALPPTSQDFRDGKDPDTKPKTKRPRGRVRQDVLEEGGSGAHGDDLELIDPNLRVD